MCRRLTTAILLEKVSYKQANENQSSILSIDTAHSFADASCAKSSFFACYCYDLTLFFSFSLFIPLTHVL